MLNLGQVVYDHTNQRVLIFGGVTVLQNQKTGKCSSMSTFCTEDHEELTFGGKNGNCKFEYSNFERDSVEGIKGVPSGEFIKAGELEGMFFGCIDFPKVFEDQEMVKAIDNTIATAKAWSIPPKPKAHDG